MPARTAKKAVKRAAPRKAAARKAAKKKISPAHRRTLVANAAKARAAKAAKAEARRNGKPERPVVDYGDLTPMQVAHGIGRYLESCRTNGDGGRRYADPAKVEAKVAKLEVESRQTDSAIKMLRMRNKIIQLRSQGSEDVSSRSFFVRYGAAYAQREGIVYAAFRDVGVPASVLKEAGIPQ